MMATTKRETKCDVEAPQTSAQKYFQKEFMTDLVLSPVVHLMHLGELSYRNQKIVMLSIANDDAKDRNKVDGVLQFIANSKKLLSLEQDGLHYTEYMKSQTLEYLRKNKLVSGIHIATSDEETGNENLEKIVQPPIPNMDFLKAQWGEEIAQRLSGKTEQPQKRGQFTKKHATHRSLNDLHMVEFNKISRAAVNHAYTVGFYSKLRKEKKSSSRLTTMIQAPAWMDTVEAEAIIKRELCNSMLLKTIKTNDGDEQVILSQPANVTVDPTVAGTALPTWNSREELPRIISTHRGQQQKRFYIVELFGYFLMHEMDVSLAFEQLFRKLFKNQNRQLVWSYHEPSNFVLHEILALTYYARTFNFVINHPQKLTEVYRRWERYQIFERDYNDLQEKEKAINESMFEQQPQIATQLLNMVAIEHQGIKLNIYYTKILRYLMRDFRTYFRLSQLYALRTTSHDLIATVMNKCVKRKINVATSDEQIPCPKCGLVEICECSWVERRIAVFVQKYARQISQPLIEEVITHVKVVCKDTVTDIKDEGLDKLVHSYLISTGKEIADEVTKSLKGGIKTTINELLDDQDFHKKATGIFYSMGKEFTMGAVEGLIQTAHNTLSGMRSWLVSMLDPILEQVTGALKKILPESVMSKIDIKSLIKEILVLIMVYFVYVNVENKILRGTMLIFYIKYLGLFEKLSSVTKRVWNTISSWLSKKEDVEKPNTATDDTPDENPATWFEKLREWFNKSKEDDFGGIFSFMSEFTGPGLMVLSCFAVYYLFADCDMNAKTSVDLTTRIIKASRNLYFAGAGLFMGIRVYNWIAPFFTTLFNWIKEKYTGRKVETKEDTITKFAEDFGSWINRTQHYNTEHGVYMARKFDNIQKDIINDYKLGMTMGKVIITVPELQKYMSMYQIHMRFAKEAYNLVQRVKSISAFRPTPFHVQFYGAIGVGKSSLFSDFTKRVHDNYFPTENNYVYPFNDALSHWDGYCEQAIIVHDDMFKQLSPDKIIECIAIITNTPLVLPMANLNEKATHCTSKWYVSSTNIPLPVTSDIADVKAIWRRRHLLIETSIVDEKYYDKAEGKFDYDGFKKDHPDAGMFDHIRFRLMSPVSAKALRSARKGSLKNLDVENDLEEISQHVDVVDGKYYTYEELIPVIFSKYDKHQSNEQRIIATSGATDRAKMVSEQYNELDYHIKYLQRANKPLEAWAHLLTEQNNETLYDDFKKSTTTEGRMEKELLENIMPGKPEMPKEELKVEEPLPTKEELVGRIIDECVIKKVSKFDIQHTIGYKCGLGPTDYENIRLGNVAGDGHCFYHTINVALNTGLDAQGLRSRLRMSDYWRDPNVTMTLTQRDKILKCMTEDAQGSTDLIQCVIYEFPGFVICNHVKTNEGVTCVRYQAKDQTKKHTAHIHYDGTGTTGHYRPYVDRKRTHGYLAGNKGYQYDFKTNKYDFVTQLNRPTVIRNFDSSFADLKTLFEIPAAINEATSDESTFEKYKNMDVKVGDSTMKYAMLLKNRELKHESFNDFWTDYQVLEGKIPFNEIKIIYHEGELWAELSEKNVKEIMSVYQEVCFWSPDTEKIFMRLLLEEEKEKKLSMKEKINERNSAKGEGEGNIFEATITEKKKNDEPFPCIRIRGSHFSSNKRFIQMYKTPEEGKFAAGQLALEEDFVLEAKNYSTYKLHSSSHDTIVALKKAFGLINQKYTILSDDLKEQGSLKTKVKVGQKLPVSLNLLNHLIVDDDNVYLICDLEHKIPYSTGIIKIDFRDIMVWTGLDNELRYLLENFTVKEIEHFIRYSSVQFTTMRIVGKWLLSYVNPWEYVKSFYYDLKGIVFTVRDLLLYDRTLTDAIGDLARLLLTMICGYTLYRVGRHVVYLFYPDMNIATSRSYFKRTPAVRTVTQIATDLECETIDIKEDDLPVDPGVIQSMFRGISRNAVQLQLSTKAKTINLKGIGIGEHMILTVLHGFTSVGQQVTDSVFSGTQLTSLLKIRVNYRAQDWLVVNITKDNIYPIPNSDACVIYHPQIPVFRKLVDKFRSEVDFKEIHGDIMQVYPCDTMLQCNIVPTSKLRGSYRQILAVGGTTVTYSPKKTLEYDFISEKGTSGSALACTGSFHKGEYLLGIQSSVLDGRSYGCIVTREDLNAIIGQIDVSFRHEGTTIEILDKKTQCEELIDANILIEGRVPDNKILYTASQTSFVHSPIRSELIGETELFEVDEQRIPAILDPYDKRVPIGTHPMQHSINKYGRDTCMPFDDTLVKRGKKMLKEYLLHKLPRRPRVIHDLEKAIRGINNSTPINLKTSPGLPYVWDRNLPGKMDYIQYDDQGNVTYIDEFLIKEVEELETKLKKQIIPKSEMYEFPKDELRPASKVVGPPIKTRSIQVMPLHYTVLYRKYHNDLEGMLMKLADGTFPFCVGINPESYHWRNMYRYFTELGDEALDIDVGNWDGHYTPQIGFAIAEVIAELYGFQKGQKEYNIYLGIIEFMFFGKVIFGDMCMTKCRGLSSGFPGTAPYNTLTHLFVWMVMYINLQQELGRPYSLLEFLNKVRLVLYGDDVMVAVEEGLKVHLNAEYIKNFYEQHGWPITSADKGDKLLFRPIVDCQFLKRKFVIDFEFGNEIVWGALEKRVIYDLCTWTRKHDEPLTLLANNLENVLEYSFPHGPKFYNKVRDLVNNALDKKGLSKIKRFTTYLEMRQRLIARYLQLNSNTEVQHILLD